MSSQILTVSTILQQQNINLSSIFFFANSNNNIVLVSIGFYNNKPQFSISNGNFKNKTQTLVFSDKQQQHENCSMHTNHNSYRNIVIMKIWRKRWIGIYQSE